MLKSIKIRILIISIILLILTVVIFIYKFKSSFLTKEERLQKFRPPTAITGLLGSDGKALFKGKPIDKNSFDYFKKLNDKIYFSFPIALDGYVTPVLGADANSFKTLAQHMRWNQTEYRDNIRSRNIGLDKNHVYCGDQKIPNFNPHNLTFLGDGYLSDQNSTYFCDWEFKAKSDAIEPNVFEKFDYAIFGRKISQTGYYYPLHKLINNSRPYKLVLKNTVTNGESIYVDGLYLKVKQPEQLAYLQIFQSNERIHQAESYTTDKINVFFKNKILDIPYHPNLRSIPFNFHIYLYDPKTNYYFYEANKINANNLKLINTEDKKSNKPIFSNQDSLFIFNTEKLKLEKISKNPFHNSLYKLSPSVLSNGKDIYFFNSYNIYSSTLFMFFSRICSSNLELKVMKNMPIFKWKKIGEISIKNPKYNWEKIQGSYWKYKEDFYYLPESGGILKLHSTENSNRFLKNQLTFSEAEKLINDKSLFEPVLARKFATYKEIHNFCFKNYIN